MADWLDSLANEGEEAAAPAQAADGFDEDRDLRWFEAPAADAGVARSGDLARDLLLVALAAFAAGAAGYLIGRRSRD